MNEPVYTPMNPSEEAINNVTSPLDIPDTCYLCGGDVVVKHYDEIYGKHIENKYPWAYVCNCCGARVGIHCNTNIPLGYLADASLRARRQAVKAKFMRLHRSRSQMFYDSRDGAYRWLAQSMGISNKCCHFAFFNHEQCDLAESLIDTLIE